MSAPTPPDDPLFDALRALPPPLEDPRKRARTRLRARARYLRAEASPLDRWLAVLGRWYTRLEPALAVGLGVVYLRWALLTAARLMQ